MNGWADGLRPFAFHPTVSLPQLLPLPCAGCDENRIQSLPSSPRAAFFLNPVLESRRCSKARRGLRTTRFISFILRMSLFRNRSRFRETCVGVVQPYLP